jgi:chymotrypsin
MLHWSHANALQVLLLVASWSSSRSSITFGAAAVAAAAATEEEEESHYQRALIIRGTNAVRGRYPYFVTLDHYGGGALIAPDIVLTAGHCKPLNRHQVQPRVGTYSFSQGDDDDHEEFDIVKMVRHPGFVKVDDDDFIHDFTILKLSGLSSNQLVKINRNHHIPSDGQDVIAMGMGNTIPDRDSRAHILQQTTLSAIPNDVCAESVDPDRELSYEGRIFPSMMCTTGGPNNERDAW